MNPQPVPKHQRIAPAMIAELYNALKKTGTTLFTIPIDYKISGDTTIQPGVLVVCGKINKKFLDFPPQLMISSFSLRSFKRKKYQI